MIDELEPVNATNLVWFYIKDNVELLEDIRAEAEEWRESPAQLAEEIYDRIHERDDIDDGLWNDLASIAFRDTDWSEIVRRAGAEPPIDKTQRIVELEEQVARLTLALGGIEQVKRLGGHDEVMIVSMQDYDELQRLRERYAREGAG